MANIIRRKIPGVTIEVEVKPSRSGYLQTIRNASPVTAKQIMVTIFDCFAQCASAIEFTPNGLKVRLLMEEGMTLAHIEEMREEFTRLLGELLMRAEYGGSSGPHEDKAETEARLARIIDHDRPPSMAARQLARELIALVEGVGGENAALLRGLRGLRGHIAALRAKTRGEPAD